MATLRQQLLQMAHADLRAIATRLQVRRRDQHQKQAWVDAIGAKWQEPEQRSALVGLLSPAAFEGLCRLVEAGELPAQPFWGEYGVVRRPGVVPVREPCLKRASTATPKPWRQPQSPSEELYYMGLLHPVGKMPIDRALRVCAPDDLRTMLAPQILTAALPAAATDAATLLHDFVQLLIYLNEHPEVRLHSGRWLPAAHLRALNVRLRRVKSPESLRTHSRSPWLAFLMFLATAGNLHRLGRLTPYGWGWLGKSGSEQLAALWRIWRDAPMSMRDDFGMASGGLNQAGLERMLASLDDQTSTFTPRGLANAFGGQNAALNTYLHVQFATLPFVPQ